MTSRILILLILALPFSTCQSQDQYDCPFPYQNYSYEDRCGFVEVPKDYDRPELGTTKLAYLVISSKNPDPKSDPVVFIQGGPGGNVLGLANVFSQINLDPNRDYILYDQRGIGFSDELCPGLSQGLLEIMAMDLNPEGEFAALEKRIQSCETELSKQSTSYNTSVNAKDLEQLRKHLGYSQLNLFGGSYGSRLGLEYMRQYPDRVRSSILFGLFPPNVRMYDGLLTNFNNALKKLFEDCKEDSNCRVKYPQLKANFYSIYNRLATQPIRMKLNGNDFVINQQDFLLILHQLMYSENTIAFIPFLINSIYDKDYSELTQVMRLFKTRMNSINIAVYWSIMKSDESHFDNEKLLRKDAQNNPELTSGLSLFAIDAEVYKQWPSSGKSSKALETVTSDIPTLLIGGDFDPITPPDNAFKAARHLKNSQTVIFKNGSHSTINACFFNIANAFLNNPEGTVNSDCASNSIQINWD
ncbi:MAG: alpha/beta fold hydrolase [Bacteroidota bacterium]